MHAAVALNLVLLFALLVLLLGSSGSGRKH
jgi:hypothetical protein